MSVDSIKIVIFSMHSVDSIIDHKPNAKVSLINLSKGIDIFNRIITTSDDLSCDLFITMAIFHVLSRRKCVDKCPCDEQIRSSPQAKQNACTHVEMYRSALG